MYCGRAKAPLLYSAWASRSFRVVSRYILNLSPPRCFPPYHLATRTRQSTASMFLMVSRMQLPEPDSPPSFFSSVPSENLTAQLRWLAFFILNCLESSLITADVFMFPEKEVPQARNRLCFSRTGVPETVSLRVRALPIRNLRLCSAAPFRA